MDTKLQKFIEAATSNPQHPIYKLGYSRHPILQSYALYTQILQTHTPERWGAEYPDYVKTMESVMKLCEETEEIEQKKNEDVETLKSEIAALKAAIAGLQTPAPAVPVAAETPAPEPSADA